MKRRPTKFIITLSAMAILLTGCQQTMMSAGKGTLAGAAGGAAFGGLMAGPAGVLGGAIIGAPIGFASGVVAGACSEVAAKGTLKDHNCSRPSAQDNPLTLEDVRNLSKAGVDDALIVKTITSSNTRFDLKSEDLVSLKNEGVSPQVIDALYQKR